MGRDAAEITPKFVPTENLRGRDNSGGSDMAELEYTQEWDDGGKVTGPKAHLSAGAGKKRGGSDEEPEQKTIGGRDKRD